MAPILTLHHGEAEAIFTEHPIEIARRALLEAAELESQSGGALAEEWMYTLKRIAKALPHREPITRRDA